LFGRRVETLDRSRRVDVATQAIDAKRAVFEAVERDAIEDHVGIPFGGGPEGREPC
jgi:hypothetical protein